MKAKHLVLFVLCFILMVTGCGKKAPALTDEGTLTVTVAVPVAKAIDYPITRVVATLSGSGASPAAQEKAPSGDQVTFTFPNVPSGTWTVTLNAYDANGSNSFQAQGIATIKPKLTTNLSLTFKPRLASFRANLDTSPLVTEGYNITAVDLLLNSTSTALTQSGSTWSGTIANIPPATYRIMAIGRNATGVVFKKKIGDYDFTPGRLLATTPDPLPILLADVPAGNGGLVVTSNGFVVRPEPPYNLRATITDTTLSLQWDDSPDRSTLQALYGDTDPGQGKYEILMGVKDDVMKSLFPPTEDIDTYYGIQWHQLDPSLSGKTVQVVVVAKYVSGGTTIYSKWSNMVEVTLPSF